MAEAIVMPSRKYRPQAMFTPLQP